MIMDLWLIVILGRCNDGTALQLPSTALLSAAGWLPFPFPRPLGLVFGFAFGWASPSS